MKRIYLTAFIAVLACGGDVEDDDDVLADTSASPVVSSDTVAGVQQPATQAGATFNTDQVKEGDKVGGLVVASKKIQSAPASPLGVTGSVSFDGEVQLTGGYRAHFDYPEVKEPCFWVDPADWAKLPRVKGDERIKWFCFENEQDAIRELGALGTETRATIVIRDYTTNLQQTNVWDTARLVRVVSKQKLP